MIYFSKFLATSSLVVCLCAPAYSSDIQGDQSEQRSTASQAFDLGASVIKEGAKIYGANEINKRIEAPVDKATDMAANLTHKGLYATAALVTAGLAYYTDNSYWLIPAATAVVELGVGYTVPAVKAAYGLLVGKTVEKGVDVAVTRSLGKSQYTDTARALITAAPEAIEGIKKISDIWVGAYNNTKSGNIKKL